MGHWALIKLAVRVLPRGRAREAVFRHIDRCSACQARLVGREEAKRWLVQAGDIGGLDGLWPSIRKAIKSQPCLARESAARIETSPSPGAGSRILRWAAAAGGIGAATAATALILSLISPRGVGFASGAVPPADPLRIQSASIAGKPAETYIIEIPEHRMILVWVEPKAEKGERS